MIYLCSPYTHPNPEVVKERVEKATKLVNYLLQKDMQVISPVVYGHNIVESCGLPGDWIFWERFCKKLMIKCDEVFVLRLEGWDKSEGIRGELDFAHLLGLKVTHVDYNF